MLNNEIGERLKLIMSALKKEMPEFIADTGGSSAKFYRIHRGEVKPNYETLFQVMAAYPQINGDWLLTGRGEMFVSATAPIGTGVDEKELQYLKRENQLLQSFLREKGVDLGKFRPSEILLPVGHISRGRFMPGLRS